MAENARRHDPDRDENPARSRRDPFSLAADLNRQHEEFAGGPTMADILADLDRYRSSDGPTRDEIVEALHEGRREREEQLDQLWPR